LEVGYEFGFRAVDKRVSIHDLLPDECRLRCAAIGNAGV
jgi:hypothetical protein